MANLSEPASYPTAILKSHAIPVLRNITPASVDDGLVGDPVIVPAIQSIGLYIERLTLAAPCIAPE